MIRFLAPWRGYEADQQVDGLAPATEQRLIDQDLAARVDPPPAVAPDEAPMPTRKRRNGRKATTDDPQEGEPS